MRLARPAAVLAVLPVIALAACGDAVAPQAERNEPPAPTASSVEASPTIAPPTYRVTGLVMESAAHGPRLCFEVQPAVLTSPPSCGGIDIAGWNWDAVDDVESAGDATRGSYTIIGTYDDQRFTLTESARPPEEQQPEPIDENRFATPCDPPAGGWAVVDAEKATHEAMEAAIALAEAEPDYGGLWLDQSINPAASATPAPTPEMNDPTRLVLNVRFTGDLVRHEAELREVWGGALCVSAAERTEAELEAVQHELFDLDGVLGSGLSIDAKDSVTLEVIVDDGLQQRMAEQYGPGVVVVKAWLQPVD